MGHVYTAEQLQNMMQNLAQMFALVRLVDLEQTTVFTIEENGTVRQEPYSVPEKAVPNDCCGDCSAQDTPNRCGDTSRSELYDEQSGYVVSCPITLVLDEPRKVVLELYGQGACGARKSRKNPASMAKRVEDVWDKVYRDPLTGAYNRRYLQEFAFMRYADGHVSHELGMIMLDLQQFKRINDNCGHLEGDRVLKEVVQALERSVRFGDSVIRMGGDEFLVILVDCAESVVRMRMEQLRKAVCTITPAEFGYAYTKEFHSRSLAEVEELLRQADQMMYREKRSNARQRDMGQK